VPDMRRTGTSVRRRIRCVVAGFVVALQPLHAATADDGAITAGRAIVVDGVAPGRPGCAACHMQDGSGQPDVGVPRLAGLTASYLLDQLNYFAAGTRQNTAMGPYARMLTRLIAAGRSPDEAVALVSDATTAHQRVLLASLCMAGVIASGLPRHAPTLIVVGPVLALREVLTPLQQAAPMTVAMMPEPSLATA
jgi:cytochrome c553